MKKISNWTDQEDKLLLDLYNEVDCFQKWKFISENFKKKGFIKNQIQCRQRYVNKLNPDLRQDKLEPSQLRNLFQYYDQYGPLWSIYQSLIPGRNQNLLKNKFYSTLRSLARVLIAAAQRNCQQKSSISSTSLSSKLLVEIYEGKKSFRKFKGVFRSILNKMNFDLDLEKINILDIQSNFEIVQTMKLQIQKSKKQCKKTKRCLQSNNLKISQNCPKKLEEIKQVTPNEVYCKEIKQKQPKIENKFLGPQNPQSFVFSFYVPPLNPLNFFVPLWNPNLHSQHNAFQKEKQVHYNSNY